MLEVGAMPLCTQGCMDAAEVAPGCRVAIIWLVWHSRQWQVLLGTADVLLACCCSLLVLVLVLVDCVCSDTAAGGAYTRDRRACLTSSILPSWWNCSLYLASEIDLLLG
jgi:hypothetical protein